MSPRSIAGWYDATHSRRNSIDVGLSNTFTVELTQKSPTSILNSSISLSDDNVEAECTQQVKRRYLQLSSIIYLIYRCNAFCSPVYVILSGEHVLLAQLFMRTLWPLSLQQPKNKQNIRTVHMIEIYSICEILDAISDELERKAVIR